MAGNVNPPNDGRYRTADPGNSAGALGKGASTVNRNPGMPSVGMSDPHGREASSVNPPNHRFPVGSSDNKYPPAPVEKARGAIPVQPGSGMEPTAVLGKAR